MYFQLENTRGYTIPLDKRLAADGRGLREDTINPNFSNLSESLYVAVDMHDKKFVCVLRFKNALCRRKRNNETRRNYEIWPIKREWNDLVEEWLLVRQLLQVVEKVMYRILVRMTTIVYHHLLLPRLNINPRGGSPEGMIETRT
jgi:hypothetical protein